MVLVDTSIWIRFLASRLDDLDALTSLMFSEQIARHDLVQGELLIGDIGGRKQFLRRLAKCVTAPAIRHDQVISFVEAKKLHGRGLDWIDAHLLASAEAAGIRLWTADARLAQVATELGLGFDASSTGRIK